MSTLHSTTMATLSKSKHFIAKQLLPLLVCQSILIPVFAQKSASASFSYDTTGIHAVQIEIPGTLTIHAGSGPTITGNYTIQATGRIWGMSNKGDSLFTKLRYYTRHDTLFIAASDTKLWVIGLSTYHENLETIIDIPQRLTASITGAENIFLFGELKKLTASSSQHIRMSGPAQQIGILHCQANSLFINESKKSRDFEYQGPGKAQLSLYAANISCYLTK